MSTPNASPPWRKAVDVIDDLVTPAADAVVRTTAFADVVAVLTRLDVQVRRRVERQTTRVWHLWNLPTAGDIRRVRAQLGVVEGRLRDMSERLDDLDRSDV